MDDVPISHEVYHVFILYIVYLVAGLELGCVN